MALHANFDGLEPRREERRERLGGFEERRHTSRVWTVAEGALACPSCDLPFALDEPLRVAAPLDCPYCGHPGSVGEFLELGDEPSAGRVDVVARLD